MNTKAPRLLLPKPSQNAIALVSWDPEAKEPVTTKWHNLTGKTKSEKRNATQSLLTPPMYKNLPDGIIVDGKSSIVTCFHTVDGKIVETDVVPATLSGFVQQLRGVDR
jgi:hypothetical protein